MTRNFKWIVTLAVCTLWCGSAALAADDANSEPLEFGYTLDYFSKYIWRGQNLNDRSVFQPSAYLSKYGFTGTIWANQDWTNANGDAGNVTEIDYALDYSNTVPCIEGLEWSAGLYHYTFPHTEFAATTEVYGGLTLTDVPFSPSFKVYRDVDEIKGTYYQFGVGHEIEKLARFSEQCYCGLQLGASVGYGNTAYNKGYFSEEIERKMVVPGTFEQAMCFQCFVAVFTEPDIIITIPVERNRYRRLADLLVI